jgi:hypothetical protein
MRFNHCRWNELLYRSQRAMWPRGHSPPSESRGRNSPLRRYGTPERILKMSLCGKARSWWWTWTLSRYIETHRMRPVVAPTMRAEGLAYNILPTLQEKLYRGLLHAREPASPESRMSQEIEALGGKNMALQSTAKPNMDPGTHPWKSLAAGVIGVIIQPILICLCRWLSCRV